MNTRPSAFWVAACLLAWSAAPAFAQPAGGLAPPKPLRGPAAAAEVQRPAAAWSANTYVRAPLTAAELQAVETSTTLNRIRSQQKLVVAFSKTGSPFSIADTDGSAKGFSIDLCTKLAFAIQKQLKLADLRIEFISPPFGDRLQAIKDGKADMECANTINTPERQQTLGFSLPVFLTVSKLLVKNESPFTNLATLHGRNVVSTANSASERVFKTMNEKLLVGAKLITRPTAADAFASLTAGEADAFFMSDIVLSDLLAKASGAAQYRLLRDAYSVDGIAIVLARGDAGMKLLVDRELKLIMSDDTIGRLYTKWFASPIPPNSVNLNLRMSQVTRDHYKRPTEISTNSLF